MLKPLNKNIILQKKEIDNKTASGIILTSEKEHANNVANVVAVADDVQTIVKGMQVVYKDYSWTTLTMDDEEYVIAEEKDILAIVE